LLDSLLQETHINISPIQCRGSLVQKKLHKGEKELTCEQGCETFSGWSRK